MANRVTASELRKVIEMPGEDEPASEIDLETHISNANLLVNEELGTSDLTEARKKLIELYLAAHFFVLTSEQGGLVKEQVGEASRSYNMLTQNRGFGFTRFGQQAMALDSTGTLSGIGSARPAAEFRVV